MTSSGPAASAGLRSGDVITAIGSTAIHGTNDLVAAIATHHPGDHVQLTVKRGSQTVTLTATPRDPADAGDVDRLGDRRRPP